MRRFYHVALVLCSACGLYAGGPKGTADDDASTIDDDASSDAAPVACSGMTGVCISALPTGWTPILRLADEKGSCPTSFTPHDIVTSPLAMPDVCACPCNITTQPSCAKGNFTVQYGTNCIVNWGLNANDGQCGVTNFVNVDAKNSVAAPKLTAGTCTFGTPMGDPKKTTSKVARVCNIPTECLEEACEGKLAGVSCIQHFGAMACPAGDFSVPFGVYGDTVTVACSACTGCGVAAQCGAGTLRYFSDSACTQPAATVAMDGTCHDTNASATTQFFKYDAPVMNPTCTATGSTPTVDLSAKRSICCRP